MKSAFYYKRRDVYGAKFTPTFGRWEIRVTFERLEDAIECVRRIVPVLGSQHVIFYRGEAIVERTAAGLTVTAAANVLLTLNEMKQLRDVGAVFPPDDDTTGKED